MIAAKMNKDTDKHIFNEEDMKSFTLICKPEQSGKTFVMIEKMIDIYGESSENGTIPLNFIFCDNNLLLSKQTSNRLDNDLAQVYDENKRYLEFSSRKGNKFRTKNDVKIAILEENHTNIICCTNSVRVDDVVEIITSLKKHYKHKQYTFNVWLDEADKYIKAISCQFIPISNEYDNFHCYCITATPDLLFKRFNGMYVMPLDKIVRDDYHGWKDNEIVILEYGDKINTEEYVRKVLEQKFDENEILSGTKWYIPAGAKKSSHQEVAKYCLQNYMAVFIVNGDGIELKLPGPKDSRQLIIEPKNDELNKQIFKMYKEHNLENYATAITGNICVSRGITIMSNDFIFTHSILSSCENKSEASQMAGRLKGGIREWSNYRKPIIYTTAKFDKIATDFEFKARELASFAKENHFVSQRQWKSLSPDKENKAGNKFEYVIHPEYFSTISEVHEFLACPHILNAMGLNKAPKPIVVTKQTRDQCGGYAVSSKLLKKGQKVGDLTADNRITKEDATKIADGQCISTNKGSKFLVLPVYDNLSTPADQEQYQVRYLNIIKRTESI